MHHVRGPSKLLRQILNRFISIIPFVDVRSIHLVIDFTKNHSNDHYSNFTINSIVAIHVVVRI